MPTEFKTLTFPNTPDGQKRKIQTLEKEVNNGWEIISETITQGKFKGKKACCLAFIAFPCAFCAGSSDGEINLTLKRG
jgi:hypothetical protein